MACWRWLIGAVTAVGLALGGGGGVAAQQLESFPTSGLDIASSGGAIHHFTVELATTRPQLAQGLMYRRQLAADAGMLFDFGHLQSATMWMKNTLIPLDMVFIGGEGEIYGIAERTVPQSLAVIASPGLVRAVLELNGGTAERLGIHAGDRVIHPIFSTASSGR